MVVQRTGPGVQRTTMPLFVQPDEGQHEDDDDDQFPSVETEVEGAPPWMPRPQPAPALAGHSSDFAANTGSGTPPPFGAEPTGSGIGTLRPIRAGSPVPMPAGPNTHPIVVMQRSIVWPLLAVAMVAIAGGALFLVWQQMQQQQAPSEIKITQENVVDKAPPPTNEPPGPTHVMDQKGSDNTVTPPIDKQPPDDKRPDVVKKQQKPKTYNEAIAEKKPEMNRCLADHLDSASGHSQFQVAITIAASGSAKSVQLNPDAIDKTPLGGCIRNVLMSVNYPSSPADQVLRFPVTIPKG